MLSCSTIPAALFVAPSITRCSLDHAMISRSTTKSERSCTLNYLVFVIDNVDNNYLVFVIDSRFLYVGESEVTIPCFCCTGVCGPRSNVVVWLDLGGSSYAKLFISLVELVARFKLCGSSCFSGLNASINDLRLDAFVWRDLVCLEQPAVMYPLFLYGSLWLKIKGFWFGFILSAQVIHRLLLLHWISWLE